MAGVTPTEGFSGQLVDVVRWHRRYVGYEHSTPLPARHNRTHLHLGFLTSAITATTDPRVPWDEVSTGTAVIYRHDGDGNLTNTGDEVTIYNRTDSSYVVDTFVEFQWKWGKWQLVAANCAATSL